MHDAQIEKGLPGGGVELLTPQEAARRLKVHSATITRLAKRGQIQSVRVGRLVRIPVTALYPAVIA